MAASMVRWLRGLYIFFLTCLLPVSAYLNLEELNEMKYGIQILPDPVIMGQAKSEDVMLVSNKYKQLYECRLPAQATKDWWTYEFCYGQHIRQYHLDDSEIKGDVLFLGYYESEFDWNNETAKASKQHRLKRYHSQSYSCRYVLTVHTTRTCHHPFLRPPSTAKPHGITCQPALSPQQYMDYVKAQVSDTKRKVEQISEELKNLDEILAKDVDPDGKTGDKTSEADAEADTKGADSVVPGDNLPNDAKEEEEGWEGTSKPDGSVSETAEQEEVQQTEGDLVEPELKEEAAASQSEGGEGETAAVSTEGEDNAQDVDKENEDDRLLQEFEEEMADLSIPSAKIDTIKEEMQKEFDNIIDEAQQELETEGLKGEFDRDQATQALETTLDKLLDRVEDKEAPEPGMEDEAPDDQVKIRVTKYKPGGSPNRQLKVQELSEGDPQMQQIKDVVKEQLERAGLKTEGKIEVKILTRRSAEEAGEQWLTEEDTKSFRELLINLLTGGTEEVYKEQKRQQELENNYRFVWGEKNEEAQSAGTSDSDDVDF
ncbi:hypothetical protein JZ751_018191 [Albula glossodonta]|uniref:Endoplasmic reticulum lectin n=1 Tax=Albula glossodonta TaxID=121402 RepID=A0A8T2PQE2_9TELE|nr:hypothetical protein JZ751_018191 [Albula glossodonta]